MSELFFVSRIGIIFYLDREWHYIAQILYSAIGIILSCEKFYFYREAQLAGLRIDWNPAEDPLPASFEPESRSGAESCRDISGKDG